MTANTKVDWHHPLGVCSGARGNPLGIAAALEAVQRLVTEHLDGCSNRRLLIWSLLFLEAWCEQFPGGRMQVAA